ncbi:MAG: hypothetical protein GF375_03205 [Candidatus Omnitrophica bacterium]|nr:hypothetical protein [Candidatus Omnitrophota bacterium]MBD3269091.1 hypothetical protein [Candidatus Omnitrophota bacterium]
MKIYRADRKKYKDSKREVRYLLAGCNFSPYRFNDYITPAEYANYLLLKKIEPALNEGGVFFGVEKDKIKAVASVVPLAWDTSYFGISMAEINVFFLKSAPADSLEKKTKLLKNVLRYLKSEKVKNVIVRLDIADISSLRSFMEEGFEFMVAEGVNIVTADKGFHPKVINYRDFSLKEAREEFIPRVLDIGKSILNFSKTRYHFDSALPQTKVHRYYFHNIRNSLLGEYGDEALVGILGGKIAGFCSLRRDEEFKKTAKKEKIDPILFAVSPAAPEGFSRFFMYQIREYILKKSDIIYARVYMHNKGMLSLLKYFDGYPFCQHLICLRKNL